jgi:hypothetical protein
MFVLMTAGTVVFTWIYERTNRSALLVVANHMGIYLDNPGEVLPSNVAPLFVGTIGYAVVAACLVVCDPKAFSRVANSQARDRVGC